MKRPLLILALLSIPALSSAQLQSETWTAYCDGNVEKVRSSFVLRLQDPIFYDYWQGEWGAFAGSCESPVGCDVPHEPGTVTHLGGNLYEFWWVWPRECFDTFALRSGRIWWQYLIDGYPEHRYIVLDCEDGPQPIIDNVDCNTLPVATSTWGAVKVLYR